MEQATASNSVTSISHTSGITTNEPSQEMVALGNDRCPEGDPLIVVSKEEISCNVGECNGGNGEAMGDDDNSGSGHLYCPIADPFRVLRMFPMYRAYLCSLLIVCIGDWFAGVANVVLLTKLSLGATISTSSGYYGYSDDPVLGRLALAWFLPKPVFAQIGGVLTDRFDRRLLMIFLDILSGLEMVGYLIAIYFQSINLVYISTIFRSALRATYHPVKTGILPMLIPDSPEDLQTAMGLNSAVYGLCNIFGSVLAGSLVNWIGLSMCYVVNCFAYLLAAFIVWRGIHGSSFCVCIHGYRRINVVASERKWFMTSSLLCQTYQELINYLCLCGFGFLLWLHASSSVMVGFEKSLDAQFSTVYMTSYLEEDTVIHQPDQIASSWNQGLTFGANGLGYALGPLVAQFMTDADQSFTLIRASCLGLACATLGWMMLGTLSCSTFSWVTLLAVLVRSMGTAIVSVYSTLLWQLLAAPEFLGRVLGTDFALATLIEATSAQWIKTLVGDGHQQGWEKESLAQLAAVIGFVTTAIWIIVYCSSAHTKELLSLQRR